MAKMIKETIKSCMDCRHCSIKEGYCCAEPDGVKRLPRNEKGATVYFFPTWCPLDDDDIEVIVQKIYRLLFDGRHEVVASEAFLILDEAGMLPDCPAEGV